VSDVGSYRLRNTQGVLTKNVKEIFWDLKFLSEVTGCRKTQVSVCYIKSIVAITVFVEPQIVIDNLFLQHTWPYLLLCLEIKFWYTVEPVRSDTWVFRHPVTSDKNFRSQNISFTFFVKTPWVLSINSNHNLCVYTSIEQFHNISDNDCSHVLYTEVKTVKYNCKILKILNVFSCTLYKIPLHCSSNYLNLPP
jgi:hypothetical protein